MSSLTFPLQAVLFVLSGVTMVQPNNNTRSMMLAVCTSLVVPGISNLLLEDNTLFMSRGELVLFAVIAVCIKWIEVKAVSPAHVVHIAAR